MNAHKGDKWFQFVGMCENRELWVGDATNLDDTTFAWTRVLVCKPGQPPSYILLNEDEVRARTPAQLADLVRDKYEKDLLKLKAAAEQLNRKRA